MQVQLLRSGAQLMASKLLRTDLPEDVWERLNTEAADHGMKIGAYVKHLILKRDKTRQDRENRT